VFSTHHAQRCIEIRQRILRIYAIYINRFVVLSFNTKIIYYFVSITLLYLGNNSTLDTYTAHNTFGNETNKRTHPPIHFECSRNECRYTNEIVENWYVLCVCVKFSCKCLKLIIIMFIQFQYQSIVARHHAYQLCDHRRIFAIHFYHPLHVDELTYWSSDELRYAHTHTRTHTYILGSCT
jgi:hypothetical protein